MSKIFVIAGNYEQAKQWIKQDIEKRTKLMYDVSWSDYVIVKSVDNLRGIQDPHGVFVGNWLGRPDILEIVQALLMCSIHVNPALGKIYKDLQPKVRPTPKTYNQAIQDAAQRMADDIDKQVIANLI